MSWQQNVKTHSSHCVSYRQGAVSGRMQRAERCAFGVMKVAVRGAESREEVSRPAGTPEPVLEILISP